MGKTKLAAEPSPDASIDELERDIERTREELGQTVEELASRAAATVKPASYALAGLGAAAVVIVCVIVWRRRR